MYSFIFSYHLSIKSYFRFDNSFIKLVRFIYTPNINYQKNILLFLIYTLSYDIIEHYNSMLYIFKRGLFMSKKTNECGVRNNFGYYDNRAKEIILKHPCLRKSEINEVYTWLDNAEDIKKLAIGIGSIENCVVDDTNNNLYNSAKEVLRKALAHSQAVDNQVLSNILPKLKNKSDLRNLSLKGYIFSDDEKAFTTLLQAIEQTKPLIYLDLTCCYLTDEQLIKLAETIAKTHIAYLVWPEPCMSKATASKVAEFFSSNHALTVLQGVPQSFQQIAQDNRNYLFRFVKNPSLISDEDKIIVKEYADSLRLGVAAEKQRLFDFEKSIEAVLS